MGGTVEVLGFLANTVLALDPAEACGGLRTPDLMDLDSSLRPLSDCLIVQRFTLAQSMRPTQIDPMCVEKISLSLLLYSIYSMSCNVMQCHAIIFSATSHSLTMRRRLRIPHSGEGVRPQWLEAKL
jgi:hypothetical protein